MNTQRLFVSALLAALSCLILLPSCGDDESQVSRKRLSSDDDDRDPDDEGSGRDDDNNIDDRPTQPPEPTFTTVSVDVLDLLITPVKLDGSPWDGFGEASEEAVRELLSLISGLSGYPGLSEVSSFVTRISSLFSSALERPDPIGSVQIDAGRGWTDEMLFDGGEDTVLANVSVSYNGYSYDSVRLLIEVRDEDLANDDNIGSVIINNNHIHEAVKRGEAIWIKTAMNNADQVLLVKIAAQGYR